jgi:hypothetical protein
MAAREMGGLALADALACASSSPQLTRNATNGPRFVAFSDSSTSACRH